jgi:hypothetical protein
MINMITYPLYQNVSDIQDNTECGRAIHNDPACSTNLGNTYAYAYRFSAY